MMVESRENVYVCHLCMCKCLRGCPWVCVCVCVCVYVQACVCECVHQLHDWGVVCGRATAGESLSLGCLECMEATVTVTMPNTDSLLTNHLRSELHTSKAHKDPHHTHTHPLTLYCFLPDMTFTHEGNKTFIDNMVNFEKMVSDLIFSKKGMKYRIKCNIMLCLSVYISVCISMCISVCVCVHGMLTLQ